MTSIQDDLYYFSVEPNFDEEESVIKLKQALEPYTVPYLACQVTALQESAPVNKQLLTRVNRRKCPAQIKPLNDFSDLHLLVDNLAISCQNVLYCGTEMKCMALMSEQELTFFLRELNKNFKTQANPIDSPTKKTMF